ncbi:MAG: restriction endonuclease subunit S [Candidatus Celaenobacter polaris]|nr:restriction endonuclease subunit S [Candidatus Celaenobacter polaris]
MKEGWELKKLNEACLIRPPKKEAKELLSSDDLVSFVPMDTLGINTKFFKPTQEKKLSAVSGSYTYFRNNDVLLAKITPCFENGKIGIAKNLKNGIGFGSSEFIVYRSSQELLPECLYYFLNQESFRKTGHNLMTGAVGHKRIPKEFYEEWLIPIPPLSEQKQIVTILDEAFAAIDQAKANIEKNIENTRELFQNKLNEIFSKNDDSWELKKFREVCGFVRGPFGGSLKKNCFKPNGNAVYEQQHAINNQFDKIRYFVDDEKFEEMKRFQLFSGDLIMSCSGTMGKVAIVPDNIKRGIINQALLKLTPNNNLSAEYLRYWMGSNDFQESIAKHSQGAAIKNVASVKILKEIELPCPPLIEQKEIVTKLDELNKYCDGLYKAYQQKLHNEEQLKKAILQNVFGGYL